MSNKFLTEDDVSSYKPQKPKYYWFRIFLSINVYAASILIIMFPLFYFAFLDLFGQTTVDIKAGNMILGMICILTYIMSALLVVGASSEGRTILFPFQQWICGLKKYQSGMYKWQEMSAQYETEVRAKLLIDKYKNYQ